MKQKTALEYADYAAYDRRQRGIQRHILMAFFAGLAIGAIGMLFDQPALKVIEEYFDPYGYLALSIYIGFTAVGFYWALMTTFLSAAASMVSGMGVMALFGDLDMDVVPGGPKAMNLLLALVVCMGMLGYFSRRQDGWGDLAAGVMSAVLVVDVIDRATPGFLDYDPSFWPVPALAIGALSLAVPFVLRRSAASRIRALVVALVIIVPAGMALIPN